MPKEKDWEKVTIKPDEVGAIEDVIPLPLEKPAGETYEERKAREDREAYIKRNEEALAARREILIRNGNRDDTEGSDPSNIEGRCCP